MWCIVYMYRCIEYYGPQYLYTVLYMYYDVLYMYMYYDVLYMYMYCDVLYMYMYCDA